MPIIWLSGRQVIEYMKARDSGAPAVEPEARSLGMRLLWALIGAFCGAIWAVVGGMAFSAGWAAPSLVIVAMTTGGVVIGVILDRVARHLAD
jgi:hypothetical protein